MLADVTSEDVKGNVKVVDWTKMVPGYEVEGEDADRGNLLREVCKIVDDGTYRLLVNLE